jgi:hypothetical protein
MAVDGISRVFEMHVRSLLLPSPLFSPHLLSSQGPTPRNDFCRIFTQEGMLEPLSAALLNTCGDDDGRSCVSTFPSLPCSPRRLTLFISISSRRSRQSRLPSLARPPRCPSQDYQKPLHAPCRPLGPPKRRCNRNRRRHPRTLLPWKDRCRAPFSPSSLHSSTPVSSLTTPPILAQMRAGNPKPRRQHPLQPLPSLVRTSSRSRLGGRDPLVAEDREGQLAVEAVCVADFV